ncbi:hypothetical protein RCC89_03420 [Cytophagaceae bacterium ABcell3]|nr:hypothetical protein RCC89_03420 [Cytophagaceae bacterium ABcell3]
MPKKLNEKERLLKDLQDDLTKEIKEILPHALRRASIILNENVEMHKLNGIVGGKNNTYVDSVRTQFASSDDFFAQWIKGLNDAFDEDKKNHLKYNPTMDYNAKASFRNVRLLQDETVFTYASKFLERNFYKHLDQRVRLKPDENLWSIWFGYQLTYGLIIAPVRRLDDWTNDKSEIRRVKYNYWTIGHVMSTGLIDPSSNSPTVFKELSDFYTFYLSVLKRLSKSQYEQQICEKYIEYLKSSNDISNEPFLIPEFRYAGLERHHEHRLDFTILNPHTEEFIGFEISPASSHMAVEKLKEKQVLVNKELKEKWGKKMSKRNKYFENFGITTITFTDNDLSNFDDCFNVIKDKLKKRPNIKPSLSNEIDRLKNH